MLKPFYCTFIVLFFVGIGSLRPVYSAPETASVQLWTKKLSGRPPIVESNKEQISKIKGQMALVTIHQIADINSGKPADFFVNLFQQPNNKDNLYSIKNYRVMHDKDNWVFDPQFSPDGTKVLFKDGWPFDAYGYYRLYILNPKTGKLQSGPSKLMSFPITRWSPDGRYILFVAGGDIDGNDNNSRYPRTLYAFDITNNQSYKIDTSPNSKYYFWTKNDTVVYLKGSQVFESSANGLKHQLVLNYASNLQVSPDGNYLLYQGYRDTKVEEKVIKRLSQPLKAPGVNAPEPIAGSHFSVYDRKAKKKYFFNQDLQDAQFIWMHGVPDKVVALTSTVALGGGVVTVDMVDLPSGKTHTIVKLPALKGEQGFHNSLYAQTQPIAITKDNKYLIILRIEQGVSQMPPWHIKDYLQAVNLSDGSVVTILEDANHTWLTEGYDWN